VKAATTAVKAATAAVKATTAMKTTTMEAAALGKSGLWRAKKSYGNDSREKSFR
jgi:hypothetical protein